MTCRLLAFYLPQYHPIPENDLWWGKGFTEWTTVVRARPLYAGHYQPHLPADLGFYDLRLPEVREQQAEMARSHGVSGFCYYYYYFAGKRLLELPLREVLATGKPDFPFCVCWANENWTRRWDGGNQQVLMAQKAGPEFDRDFILGLLPAFQDERYIRVDGRPLLLVYRTDLLPHPTQTVDLWRNEMARHGIDLYLCLVEGFAAQNPAALGFDAACEFPPCNLDLFAVPPVNMRFPAGHPFAGHIYDYRELVQLATRRRTPPSYKRFLGVSPSWDNTPRRGRQGNIFINSTPELFGEWLSHAVQSTEENLMGDERLIFVNAWNEWGEGCHLEPDERFGTEWLDAVRSAMWPSESLRDPRHRTYNPPLQFTCRS